MKTTKQIEQEINTLLKEVEVIIDESKSWKKGLALSMLLSLKRKIRDQFININKYLADEKR